MSPAATIGVLNCRVRLPAGATGVDAGRIDSLARRQLPTMLSDRLAATDGSDPRILVARSLTTRIRLRAQAGDDERFCDLWARGVARDMIELVDREPAPSADVRVFPDRTSWISACLVDLLIPYRADPPWWHGPLAAVTRGKSRTEAIIALFEAERVSLLPILANLDRQGHLTRLLDALPPATRVKLMADAETSDGLGDALAHDRQRPILKAALAMLELPGSAMQNETLLRQWLVQAGPPAPEWQSRISLADAIVAACQFIVDSQPGGRAALNAMLARGPAAFSALNWLDRDRLHAGLQALTAGPSLFDILPDAITRALAAALDDAREQPDRLALRTLARLAAEQPRLAALTRAKTAIRMGTPLALQLARLPEHQRSAAVRAYRMGRGPLDAGLTGEPTGAASSHRVVATVLDLLATRLAAVRPVATTTNRSNSGCIGAAVLLRAISDVNLARALAAARAHAPSLPEMPALLAAALFCCWAGPAAVGEDGRVDPGIRITLGDQVPERADDLAAGLAAIHPDDLTVLVNILEDSIVAQPRGGPARSISSDDLVALTGPPRLKLDPIVSRMASRVLVHWAGWLKGFEGSSSGWLLDRAVRRTGYFSSEDDLLNITMPPLPLDLVLRGAGYLDPLAPPPWMRWRRISFHLDGQDF